MGFWGDMLKILAHTGMQTGGSILSDVVGTPIKEAASNRLMANKALIEAYTPTLTTGTVPEQEAAATFLEGISGSKLPRAPRTNPAGTEITSSEGAKLTAPASMNLSDLAPGESTTMGLVRPPAQKLEGLSTGLLTRGVTGTPEDVKYGATILNTLKPARKMGDLEYLLSLDPTQRSEAVKLLAAKGHPEFATYLSGPEGKAAVEAYNRSKRAPTATDVLLAATGNSDLAANIGAAATAIQPKPPNVAVINPDQPLPATAPKGSIVTPSKTAKEPSLVEQEQKLLGTVTGTLGKVSFNMPGETRAATNQLINQTIGQLNEVRLKQNKPPITTGDLINNEFNKAMKVLDSSRKTLGEENYAAKVKMLKDRKDQMLLGIGAQ